MGHWLPGLKSEKRTHSKNSNTVVVNYINYRDVCRDY